MAVELNIQVRIKIGESTSPSSSLHLTKDKNEPSSGSNYLVWMMLGLKIEIFP